MRLVLVRALSATLVAGFVGACGQSMTPTPEDVAAADAAASELASGSVTSKPPAPTVSGSVVSAPPLPSYAQAMMGKNLSDVATVEAGVCIGTLDAVAERYAGPPSAISVSGWAWNKSAGAPYSQMIAIDDRGIIIGVGIGAHARPDVVKAMPDIVTSPTNVGWLVLVQGEAKRVRVFGFDPGSKIACYSGEKVVSPA